MTFLNGCGWGDGFDDVGGVVGCGVVTGSMKMTKTFGYNLKYYYNYYCHYYY